MTDPINRSTIAGPPVLPPGLLQAQNESSARLTAAVLRVLEHPPVQATEFSTLKALHAQVVNRSDLPLTDDQKNCLFHISLDLGLTGISGFYLSQAALLIPFKDRCQETLMDLVSLFQNLPYVVKKAPLPTVSVEGCITDMNFEALNLIDRILPDDRAAFISWLITPPGSPAEKILNINLFEAEVTDADKRADLLEALMKLSPDERFTLLSFTVAVIRRFFFLDPPLRLGILQAFQEIPAHHRETVVNTADPFFTKAKGLDVQMNPGQFLLSLAKISTLGPEISSTLNSSIFNFYSQIAGILSIRVLLEGIADVSQQIKILQTISTLPGKTSILIVTLAGEIAEITGSLSADDRIALLLALKEIPAGECERKVDCALPYLQSMCLPPVQFLQGVAKLPGIFSLAPALEPLLENRDFPIEICAALILGARILLQGITDPNELEGILQAIKDLPKEESISIVLSAERILEVARPLTADAKIAILLDLKELLPAESRVMSVTSALPLFREETASEIGELLQAFAEVPVEDRVRDIESFLTRLYDENRVEGDFILFEST